MKSNLFKENLHDDTKDDKKTQHDKNTSHEDENNLHFLHVENGNIFHITIQHHFDKQ